MLRNQKIGFVFQNFNLLPRTTALENVELPLLYAAQPVPAGQRHGRGRRSSSTRSGWAPAADHTPNQLSGGQQQRVAIARALVNEPDVLLADEPTGNLDTRTSIEIMEILQRLNRERGITIMLITHEHDIAEYGDRGGGLPRRPRGVGRRGDDPPRRRRGARGPAPAGGGTRCRSGTR